MFEFLLVLGLQQLVLMLGRVLLLIGVLEVENLIHLGAGAEHAFTLVRLLLALA